MMRMYSKDFPIFKQKVHGHPLIYLDNAATTQKPLEVIQAEIDFYTTMNANIHRSIHTLGERATTAYEEARAFIARYLGAKVHEVVFTSGTTEGINAVAHMWGLEHIRAGQTIVLSQLEHHANLLPWQYVARKTGATLKFIPIDAHGKLVMDDLDQIITDATALVAVTHLSNVLGTHVDLAPIVQRARAVGAKILVDAAQSIAHQKLDVAAMDVDFLVFSGHKVCGPTGVGILYINQTVQSQMEPYQRGGSMVHSVDWTDATWAKAPHKFEAGTPPIAQAIGLRAAFEYLEKNVDFGELQRHEALLCRTAIERLQALPLVKLYGPLDELAQRGHMINFTVEGVHAHDVAAYLDTFGIAVRAGNHCSQPLSTLLGVNASVRASFYFYTTIEDVHHLCDAVERLCKTL
jgi:cysteine desulfurase/selenocysteine lyase